MGSRRRISLWGCFDELSGVGMGVWEFGCWEDGKYRLRGMIGKEGGGEIDSGCILGFI